MLLFLNLVLLLFVVLIPWATGTEASYFPENSWDARLAMMLYVGDFDDKLPDLDWQVGPYKNSNKLNCGGEWQKTPAIQLDRYINAPLVWVCPTKRRGLTYTTEPGTFNPAYTGFLSYGFNYLGVFGLDESKAVPTYRKHTGIQKRGRFGDDRVGGSSNPKEIGGGIGNEKADAAWLDEYWSGRSYPTNKSPKGGNGMTNPRFQSQQGKHIQKVNVVYLDGHSIIIRPSRLVWGQFYATYDGKVALGFAWDTPVSSPAGRVGVAAMTECGVPARRAAALLKTRVRTTWNRQTSLLSIDHPETGAGLGYRRHKAAPIPTAGH
jgi:prepilin-type processing-associated H-X9-DG protein